MTILDNLAGVVDNFQIPGGVKLERRTSSIDGDGNPVRGEPRRTQLQPVTVHPARGRDLLRLPEGDRTLETIVVFTREQLHTAREGVNEEADVLLYNSGGGENRYVVVSAEDWNAQSGHWRCMAQRRESDR